MTATAPLHSPARSRAPAAKKEQGSTTFFIALFFVALLLPYSFSIGSIRLSPTRLYLLVALVPCLALWLSGHAGRKHSFDFYMILYALWAAVSLGLNDGFFESLESMGIVIIETLGAYFLARCTIINEASFRRFAKIYFSIVLVLLPFAMVESITGRPILIELARKLGPSIGVGDTGVRLGLRRAQVLFEHPILFGMFSGSSLSLAFYALKTPVKATGSIMRSLLVFLTAFFSLSTGAIVSIAVQYIQIIWDNLTRGIRRRWLILSCIVLFFYVLIDSLSNRNPFEIFVSYLTFSSGSSYNRILIWQFGTAQVWKTPWFGIGLTGDWERPRWMGSSMDNFWLLTAVRYGFPAFLFLALSIITMLRRAGARQIEKQSVADCRSAIIMSIVGLIVGACTVHLWNNAYAYFMFMVGSIAWITNEGSAPHKGSEGRRPTGKTHRMTGEPSQGRHPASDVT